MKQQIADNWYEDFFQGIACEVWENAVPVEMTNQEVDFLLGELNLQPGQRILDVQCGFGRHAIPLARKGFEVVGIDISETFIRNLAAKSKAEYLPITAIRADILSVPLEYSFSAAICMGNSFGYFGYDKLKRSVEKVAFCLQPGAKFVINSGMLAESILPNLLTYAKQNTYTIGDVVMEVSNEYDAGESCLVSNLLYTRGAKTEAQAFKHYVFTLGEIRRLLESCGLRLIAAYGDVSLTEFKLGDRQAYLVAEKKARGF